MNAELFEALKLLEETKGIPVDYMLEKVEAGLVSAFRKQYGNASVRVDINKEKKSVRVFARRTVDNFLEKSFCMRFSNTFNIKFKFTNFNTFISIF